MDSTWTQLTAVTMSCIQASVSRTLTATGTPKYRTFNNDAEYKSWLAEFNAQNGDGQRAIDFRVCHFCRIYNTSFHSSYIQS